MFIDQVTIKVRGGNGGNGCVSFRREKFVPKGGPDGGDGGDGGGVILKASEGKQSLVDLYYLPHYEGDNGQHGKGSNCHGANGTDTVVEVPVGTVVFDADTGECLVDLAKPGAECLAARPGRGGGGNRRFVSSTHRAPRIADEGTPGEERTLRLELKTVADVGLVGYPNAGKSTLIGAISQAHPKVAPYPFTTLRPNVGIVSFPDFFRFSVADIPGLIEGAHQNVGLGHDFLRHIERCRILLYVVDTAGTDGREPAHDLASLKKELELHKKGLSTRPSLIAANKMDMPVASENLASLERVAEKVSVFPISAVRKETARDLVQQLRKMLEEEQSRSR